MKLDYDYINPVTGKKTVLLEGVRMLCMETGYHTFKGWNEKDQGDMDFFNNSPESVRNSRFVDDLGQVWYKITLFTETVVLQPSLYDGWVVNQFRDLYIDEVPGEKLQRIVKGLVGQDVIQVLDPLCGQYFLEFSEAYDEFNKRKNEEDV